MNHVILTGRLINIDENLTEEKRLNFTLAIKRYYKNEEGVYETDFIKCKCFNNTAKSALEYCKIGDLIGIRGQLQNENSTMIVSVERLTFLSTKKEED